MLKIVRGDDMNGFLANRCGNRVGVWPVLVVAAFVLTACSSDEEIPYVERPAEDIFREASAALENEEFVEAAQLFDEVERQHPYSPFATQAQLMAAFAYYEDLKYDDAVLALERFIQLHPGNERVSYAYYLRALCFYERIVDVRRDQRMTEQARDALGEVVRRFPDSEYARDAQLKYDLTTDHLAGKNMEIGRYYLTRGNHNAAIGRFRRVVEDFDTTTHVPEALHRLVEAYLALGISQEAQAAAAVLGHNYPGNIWYQESYALLVDASLKPEDAGGSWLSNVLGSVL